MDNPRTAAEQALEQPEQAEPVEIKPPNPEGATQCIVRWMAETPAGWVGAWDRAALAQFVTQPRREWQSLSEEEIIDAVRESDLDWQQGWTLEDSEPNRYTQLTRAIEQALKEKNA